LVLFSNANIEILQTFKIFKCSKLKIAHLHAI
jgi:hypothetical protein